MKYKIKFLSAIFCLFISSCANINQEAEKQALLPLNYLDPAPKYNIKNFLDGNLEISAIVQDENDKIISSFSGKINGKWEENKGTVSFSYKNNSGKKESRTWLISLTDDENYQVIGHDFLSPAKGRQMGNASQIIYSMSYEFKEKKDIIDFEENLYLVDQNSAIIIAKLSTKQIKLGKIIFSIKKSDSEKLKNSLSDAISLNKVNTKQPDSMNATPNAEQ